MSLREEFNKVREYFKSSDHEYLQRHPEYRKLESIEIDDGCIFIYTGPDSLCIENLTTIEEVLDSRLLDERKEEEDRKKAIKDAQEQGYKPRIADIGVPYSKYLELRKKGLL